MDTLHVSPVVAEYVMADVVVVVAVHVAEEDKTTLNDWVKAFQKSCLATFSNSV